MTRIAIIGTGLSGLSVAHFLKDYADVTLFEKARGVSGRMSTRRAGAYYFDHGAQYFTARTTPFQDFIQPLLEQGLIERWNARYVKFKGSQIIERKNWYDEAPRYVGVPGMNHVAQSLAKGLNIHLNTSIVALNHQGTWQLTDKQDQQYTGFDWVISTAPAPQTLGLFPTSSKYYEAIKMIEMRACFSLMLGFKHSFPLSFEAAHVIESDLSWIAVNSHKPQRSNLFTMVVHSSEAYAEAHINEDRDHVMQHLINETRHIIGQDVSHANYQTVHGWRYANNTDRRKSALLVDEELKLAACGDWCVGGRVEGAFTSAYHLAQQMKACIL